VRGGERTSGSESVHALFKGFQKVRQGILNMAFCDDELKVALAAELATHRRSAHKMKLVDSLAKI
jgi:hypothetical protein